jgi:dihydrofolate reductase
MAQLVYTAITSLDGYVADEAGTFEWAAPDEEVHAFVNDLQRSVGTYLYGRRMYETMRYWETAGDDEPVTRDFAEVWRAADKVVYSRTLAGVDTARTRLESDFDPREVRRLVAGAGADVGVGGPTLAAHAFAAGLVEQIHLFLTPIVVGGGLPALPTGLRLPLVLVDEHRFAGGVVHLHHRVA